MHSADTARSRKRRKSAGAQWQELRRQRLEWEKNAQAVAAEREQLQWQVQELTRLAFGEQEWSELQADHGRLAHAASLIEAVEHALEALSESEGAALATINGVISRLNAAQAYDSGLKESARCLAARADPDPRGRL